MSKIPLEIIAEALNSNDLDQETISKVMNDITHMAQVLADEEKAQREPVVKKQFIIVLSDPRRNCSRRGLRRMGRANSRGRQSGHGHRAYQT